MLGEGDGETVTTVTELLDRVPEEEHAAISEKVFAALKGDEPHYDIDHHVRRADGTLFWVRSRGRVIARAPDGHALRMVGTNADISARKITEEAQIASEARLRTMMDSVASSLCHIDLSGRILFANKRYHELFGLEDGAAVGRSIRDIAGSAGASAFERCLPQLLAGNEARYEREVELAGRRARIEVQLVPHRDPLGATDSAYAVITDLSTRRASSVLDRVSRQQT
jgi:PAS domain S-box-containing protein